MSLRYKISSKKTRNYITKDIGDYYSLFSDEGKQLLDKHEHFLLSGINLVVLIKNVQLELEKLLKVGIKRHRYFPPNEVEGILFNEKRIFDLRNEVENKLFNIGLFHQILTSDDKIYFEFIPLK